MNYIDAQGRELFVADGISPGTKWMTFYRKPTGSLKRMSTPALPIHPTREEAQKDLDEYARRKGFKPVETTERSEDIVSAVVEKTEGSLLDKASREYKELETREIFIGGNIRSDFDEAKLAELAESIRKYGILEPLLVRPLSDKSTPYITHVLIAGERRLRAAKIIGFKTVPCVVVNLTPGQARQVQILENLQRQDLNPMEEAKGIEALMWEFGWTQREVADQLSKSQPWVAQRLGLLELPKVAKDAITRGIWSVSHGEAVKPFAKAPAIIEFAVKKSEEQSIPVSQIRSTIENEIRQKGKRVYKLGYRYDGKEPEFDVGPCQNCDRMVRLSPEYGDAKPEPYCTDVACWERKQKAAQDERVAAALKPKAAEDLLDLSHLSSDVDYHHFWSVTDIPADCNGCEHLKRAKSEYGQAATWVVCMNVKCWKRRVIAENKAKRESQEEKTQARLTGLMDECRRQGFIDSFALLPRRLQVFLAGLVFHQVRPSGEFNVQAWRKQNLGWDSGPGHDYKTKNEEWRSFAETMHLLPAMDLAAHVFEWLFLERITLYTPALQSIEYLLGHDLPKPAADPYEIREDGSTAADEEDGEPE